MVAVQLTKDIILDQALEILDEYGLGDLTIRRLTKQLGTAPGAMYWHFSSKQILLGAVADRILAPITEFTAQGDWQDDVHTFVDTLYDCLTAHRDGAEVVSAALATATASVRPECVLADALSNIPADLDALDTAATIVFFTLGITVDEQTALALDENTKKKPNAERLRLGIELLVRGIAAS